MPALRSEFGAHLKSPPAFAGVYASGYGIHFRHHNTSQAWDLCAQDGRKIAEGEAALGQDIADPNRRMNNLAAFGGCRPYLGLKHPIRP